MYVCMYVGINYACMYVRIYLFIYFFIHSFEALVPTCKAVRLTSEEHNMKYYSLDNHRPRRRQYIL